MQTRLNKYRWLFVALAVLAGTTWTTVRAFELSKRNGYVYTWNPGTVTMQLKLPPPTAPLSDGSASYNASVRAAMEIWNGVIGVVRFAGQEATVGAGTEGNGVNEISLDSTVDGDAFPERTLAITVNYSSGDTRTESDIVFNSAYNFDSYRGNTRSRPDIQRVAIHELGHALGLSHPDEAGQTVTAIMNSTTSNVATAQSDDIAGAQTLYGAPGFVPANNNFSNATNFLLSGTSSSTTGSNVAATKEAGEPSHAANAGGHSVWWRWVAPSNGRTTVTTLGSNFDTLLGIYTGTAVGALTSQGFNDDQETPAQNPGSNRIRTSLVAFDATAGTTYYFAVDGWDAHFGAIQVNLTFTSTGGGIPPVITTQPASQSITTGGTATFSVVASGNPTGYQWLRDNAAISGATSATLTVSNAQATDAGSYTVTVSNTFGSVTSNAATLSVSAPAPLPPPTGGGSSGGGGGGGAPSFYFLGALVIATLVRWWRR